MDSRPRRSRGRRAALVGGTVLLGLGMASAAIAGRSFAEPQPSRTAPVAAGASSSAPSRPAAAANPSTPATAAPSRTATPKATATAKPKPKARSTASPAPAASARGAGGSTKRAGHPAARTSVAPGAIASRAWNGRLFAASSFWNTPIPAGAPLDPQSTAIRDAVLTNKELVVNMAVRAYGIPFYTAKASTPRVVLKGRGGTGEAIPLSPSWQPNEGGDRKMNVLDPANDKVYELQGYEPATHSAYWMVVRDLSDGLGDGAASGGRSGPTGSGISQAGGVIRTAEIRAGRIDHALSFITSRPVAKQLRYPATYTDGTATGSGIAEGMRIQLDPSLDVDAIPGIGRGERAVAKALQRYGAFCTDNGGGNNMAMGFYAEQPTAESGDPYAAAGLPDDWVQLPHIPRSALRVVAASVTAR